MYRYREEKVLKGESIRELFERKHREIENVVTNEPEDYILNVNEQEYIEHLYAKYTLLTPTIHFDDVTADVYEDEVPAEYFPRNFHVFEGQRYKKEIFKFMVPCSGDVHLLNYSPASTFYMGGRGNFQLRGNELVAEFINFSNNPQEIKSQYDREVSGLTGNYQSLVADVQVFDSGLKDFIGRTFRHRRERLLNRRNVLGALGVPLKKKDSTPSTFSVPKPVLREKISIKPVVHEKGFKPEPTLSAHDYYKILKIINDVGKNFERMPSTFHGKSEEDLRDHILMVLDPNFELGSASGETFNKSGKTDIQLRYDSSVVFISECKFWKGEKGFSETIDQLLGYLTWRDTKASIVLFVKQKDFSAIVEKITPAVEKHPNYLGSVAKTDETWFNFRIHLNGDKNREVKLAVQLFHLPD